jgi:hypothetical protein
MGPLQNSRIPDESVLAEDTQTDDKKFRKIGCTRQTHWGHTGDTLKNDARMTPEGVLGVILDVSGAGIRS